MFKWNQEKLAFIDPDTGEVLKTKNSQVSMPDNPIKKTMDKKDNKKGRECPGHVESIKVLSKKINVYAGSATKTQKIPRGAIILDLADKFSLGISVEGGLKLPDSLVQKRIIIDWPDMSKPYMISEEWEILTDWIINIPEVKENGLFIACQEGHGRTGTCLSILAHFLGEWDEKVDLVRMIRKIYCNKSVETTTQIEYFEKITGRKTKCRGSNGGTYWQGGTTTFYGGPGCEKTIKSGGAGINCEHSCSRGSSDKEHQVHWCNKCQWDWWIEKDGSLNEKPGPQNSDSRGTLSTPGPHVIHIKGKDPTPLLPIQNATASSGCWELSPFALDGLGECDKSDSPHICGGGVNHPGRHVCFLCKGLWESGDSGESTIIVPQVYKDTEYEALCLAQGGLEQDHVCVCKKMWGHDTEVNHKFDKHLCDACSKEFDDAND